MSTVTVGLSISADGYVAGPNDGPANPLGDGGHRLFAWMNAGPARNRINRWLCPPTASLPVVEGWTTGCGALLAGRRTFDIANGWRDGHPVDAPIFVVTHRAPTEGEWHPKLRFVTGGVEEAVRLASEVAGDGVVSASAAGLARSLLGAGLLDELELNVVPCLLGGGVSLFGGIGPAQYDLEQLSVIPSDGVTHVRYRVSR